MVNQHESPFYDGGRRRHAAGPQADCGELRHQQGLPGPYPTYPSGHWLFGFASKKYHPVKDLNAAGNLLGIHTQYYNTRLHAGAFALPSYVEGLLKDVEP